MSMAINKTDLESLNIPQNIADLIFQDDILQPDYSTLLINEVMLGKIEYAPFIKTISDFEKQLLQSKINTLENTVTQVKQSKNSKELSRDSFPYDAGWWTSRKSVWQSKLSELFSSEIDQELLSLYFSDHHSTSYSLFSKIRAKCSYFQQPLTGKILHDGLTWHPATKLNKQELSDLKFQVTKELGYDPTKPLDEEQKKEVNSAFNKAKKQAESEGHYTLTNPSIKATIHRSNMVDNLLKSLDLYEFQVNHGLEFLYLQYLALQELFSQKSWQYKLLVKSPSKLTKELFNEEDWDWLSGKEEGAVYNKERTVNFSIDKDKLYKVYQEMKESGSITTVPSCNLETKDLEIEKYDLEGIGALLMFLEESNDLGSSKLETTLKCLGVKPISMKGDNTLKNPKDTSNKSDKVTKPTTSNTVKKPTNK